MRRPSLLISVLAALLFHNACTAPPPERSEEETRRPRVDKTKYSVRITDNTNHNTLVRNLKLRGAAKALESDEWRFFELTPLGGGKPVAIGFNKLSQLRVDARYRTQLQVTLWTRDKKTLSGTLKARTFLEGETDWGPVSIKLRKVRKLKFLSIEGSDQESKGKGPVK